MSGYRDDPIQLNKNETYTTDDEKEEVLNELMTTLSQKVYLLAYSFVKDRELAEDISQEVFIKCYRHMDKYRGDASITSWVYRITVNTSKDFLRKNKLINLIYPRHFFENKMHSESTEEIFLKQNRKDHLLQTISRLPIKYREILVLYYFHDQKIEEIAESLAINSNTVRTRLARGRTKLKQKITSLEGE